MLVQRVGLEQAKKALNCTGWREAVCEALGISDARMQQIIVNWDNSWGKGVAAKAAKKLGV